MMFPMLNSLKLTIYVCYFVQLMHFSSIIRFLMDYAIGCVSRSIILCEIAPSHNIRSPA